MDCVLITQGPDMGKTAVVVDIMDYTDPFYTGSSPSTEKDNRLSKSPTVGAVSDASPTTPTGESPTTPTVESPTSPTDREYDTIVKLDYDGKGYQEVKITKSDWLAKSVDEDPTSVNKEGEAKPKKPNSSLERMGMKMPKYGKKK